MFNVKNCTLKAKGLDLGAEPPILCRVHPRSLAPLGGPYLDKYARYHRTHGKPKPILSTLLK